MTKVSGRRNAQGRSNPIRNVEGSTTRTPSDDKPHSAKPALPIARSESEKIEARPKLPANRNKVKPIGHAKKPRAKTA
jgi:hypothetical protein